MPYLMGVPFQSGVESFLLDVDFSAWSLGFYDASTLHSQTYTAPVKSDLVLIRNYTGFTGGTERGETVRTSEATLLQSAIADQTNVARIGRRLSSSKAGLVVQPATSNYFGPRTVNGNDVRDFFGSSGTGGGSLGSGGEFTDSSHTVWTTSHTYPIADSPNQNVTGCMEIVASITTSNLDLAGGSSGPFNYGPGITFLANTNPMVASAWIKNATKFSVFLTGSPGSPPTYSTTGGSGTWARLIVPVTGGSSVNGFMPVDGTNPDPAVGTYYDALVDYCNLTLGTVEWECIPSTFAACAGERLRYSTGSALVAVDGQIKVRALLSPLHSSSTSVPYDPDVTANCAKTITYEAAWYLFSWGKDARSYAKIKGSDRKLYVKIESGTEYASTNALSFAAHDEVEIFVAVGNGHPSNTKYRVNGGAWTDLVLATVPDVPAPSSNFVAFLYNDDTATNGDASKGDDKGFGDVGQFACRLHRLTVFKSGKPSGT
jgi:hypothetical protein